MAVSTNKKKIDVKSMALGAGAMVVLSVVPAIGDAISKMIASIRNKISGRK